MCMCRDKFLHGGCLVWFEQLGFVAAIGPECADKENMRLAIAGYDAKVQAEREEYYLIERLPLVPKRLRMLETILPAFVEAARVHRAIKRKAPKAKKQIAYAVKQGGILTIEEEIEPSLRGIGPRGLSSGENLRTVHFGALFGKTIKLNKFEPDAKLSRVIATLDRHKHWWSEERALMEVARGDATWRHEAYEYLRDAEEQFTRIRADLLDFRSFFRNDNVDRISNWCQHPAHSAPFKISLTRHRDPDGMLLEIVGPDRDHARVLIKLTMLDRALPSKLFPV